MGIVASGDFWIRTVVQRPLRLTWYGKIDRITAIQLLATPLLRDGKMTNLELVLNYTLKVLVKAVASLLFVTGRHCMGDVIALAVKSPTQFYDERFVIRFLFSFSVFPAVVFYRFFLVFSHVD